MSATESADAPRESDPSDKAGAPEAGAADAGAARAPALGPAFWRKWAFALVPLIGLWELGAHIVQIHSVVSEEEWKQARAAVESERKPGDLVVFAPYWADPLGREYFGSTLASSADEARPDESRYARAFEVSIRGQHADEIASWPERERRKVGPFTITLRENPSPAKVLDDLVTHATPDRTQVSRVDRGGTSECPWARGPASAGGLGAGPAIPGNRFSCAGGAFVGESIIFEPSFHPRRCLYAPPGGHNIVTRIVFQDVPFGTALHGHAGLQYESDRAGGADTFLTWKVGDQTLGRIVHRDGDGWKSFELTTTELQGKRADLVAEVTTPGNGRQYCFEADTR